MKILAIRLARFGDIVLLLPALSVLKAHFPDSHLTLLTDERWAPLGEMCPAIDEIIPVDRLAMRDGRAWRAIAGIASLARDIRRRRFDLVIDFHGFRETNLLAFLSGARQRLGLRRFDQSFLNFCFNLPPVIEDKSIHVSEMFVRVARLVAPYGEPKTPALVVPDQARQWAKANLPLPPLAALYIDAPVPERMWPPEHFALIADHIIRRFGARVVVLSGPNPKGQAASAGRIPGKVFSNLSIPQLAAAIGSAQVLISNDTGPLHLGPALGVPTVGIFSVGIPTHFRPTGAHDYFVQGNPIESIRPEKIIEGLERILTQSS